MSAREGAPSLTAPPLSAPSLSDDLRGCKQALHAEVSNEKFGKCLNKVLKDEVTGPSKFCCIFKVVWLSWLCFLAFCLVVAGFKPIAFFVHKAIHDKLYYILRPIRLAMVTILPYLHQVGLDFLNTDCMLKNPLLSGVDGCACFTIKYPHELMMNDSVLPGHIAMSELLDVYVLRNVSQFHTNFSIMDFVDFPSLHGGSYPQSCYEIAATDSKLYRYDEFFQQQKMMRLLKEHKSWTFSWEECPDSQNPLTLHSIIPPVQPVSASPNSTFTIITKWGTFTHHQESLESGAVIVVRVLIGEARFVMEPRQEECYATCSTFRENPVLRQGDALLFDQRVWTYLGIAWTDVAFVTVQLVSLA